MMGFLARLWGSAEPSLSQADAGDAAQLAALHAASFRRGWSEEEMERLLLDHSVIAHRALLQRRLAGFILSRRAADEAEILSVAVGRRQRGRGLARRLLHLHLRSLAGCGVRAVFLEVDEDNAAARRLYAGAGFREVSRRQGYYRHDDGRPSTAVVLRRDL